MKNFEKLIIILGIFLFTLIPISAIDYNDCSIYGTCEMPIETLVDLKDTKITNPLDMQTLIYNANLMLWQNDYLNDSSHSVNDSILWNGHAYEDEGHWGISGSDIFYNAGDVSIGQNLNMGGDINMNSNNIVDTARVIFNLTTCNDDEVFGTLCHDEEHDTLKYYTVGGQVIQLSQEVSNPMKNKESFMVLDGSYVYMSGTSGDNLEFKLAKADNFSTSGMVGVLTRPCEPEEICAVTFFGFVNGIDTSVYSLFDKRYLSATESGNATITSPGFPNNILWMDTVVRVNSEVGRTFVFPRLDTANGMTFNTIGVIGDIIQTDYKISSLEGHDNLNGKNVFTIMMNGTTGIEVPHLTFQPGGEGQASIWTRSGIVVPENLVCLNNTNRTDAQCWADAGGFTWNIADFNTTNFEGADWAITGELEVIKSINAHLNISALNFIGGAGFFDNIYNREEVDELIGGASLELYFKNTTSGISTYWDMNQSANGRPKNSTSITLSADSTEIGNFISPNASDLGIAGLDEGIIDSHFHANVDLVVGKKQVNGYFEVHKRLSNGTEIFLTRSHLVTVDTTVETEYEAHASLLEEIILNDGDRIVMKLFANLSGAGGNPTLTTYIQGDTLARGDFSSLGVNFATKGDLESYVPYVNAHSNVDLGDNNFTVDTNTLFVNSNTGAVGIGTLNNFAGYKLAIGGNTIWDNGYVLIRDTTWGVNLQDNTPLTLGNNADYSFGSDGVKSYWSVGTNLGSTTGMTMDGSGNVGIGIDNPIAKLTVRGDISLGGADEGGYNLIWRGRSGGAGDLGIYEESYGLQMMAPDNIIIGIDSNANDVTSQFAVIQDTKDLYANNGDVLPNNALFVVQSNGKVGIGTTAPSSKLHINGTVGSLAGGLAFGDGDSGIYEFQDDRFFIVNGGAANWLFDANNIGSATADGPTLRNEVVSATNPTILPYRDDYDTGIGHAAANQLSLIAGGVEGIRVENGQSTVFGDTNSTNNIYVGNNVTLYSGAVFWSNSTCAFISSPNGGTVLEVCDP